MSFNVALEGIHDQACIHAWYMVRWGCGEGLCQVEWGAGGACARYMEWEYSELGLYGVKLGAVCQDGPRVACMGCMRDPG